MAGCENDYAAPTTIPPYGNHAMKKSGKFSSLQKEDFSRRRGGLDKFDFEQIVVQVCNGMEYGGAGDCLRLQAGARNT